MLRYATPASALMVPTNRQVSQTSKRNAAPAFSIVLLLILGSGLTLLAVLSFFLVIHPPLSQTGAANATFDIAIDSPVIWFTGCMSLLGAACVIGLACSSNKSPQSSTSTFSGMEAEALLETLLSTHKQGVFILDPSGRVIETNNTGAELLGDACGSVNNDANYFNHIPKEDHSALADAIENAVEGIRTEFYIRPPSNTNSDYPIKHIAIGHTSPSTKKSLVVLQTEEARDSSMSPDRMNRALDVAKLGLWDVDVQSDDAYYSDYWYEMLGYEPGELPMTAKSWRMLLHPNDADQAVSRFITQSTSDSDDYNSEFRLRTKSGDWKWIKDVGRIIERSSNGLPTRALGVHIDNDAAKRHELALKSLAAIDSSKYGTTALTELCRALGEAYESNYVAFSKVINHGRVRVIAGWQNGQPLGNIEYDIANTPCGVAMSKSFCHYRDGVTKIFPDDHELQLLDASGYCGLRLTGRAGNHIGLLTLITKHPLEFTDELESTIRLVGARAASEIERGVIEQSLHATQDRLMLAIRAARQGFWDWDLKSGNIYFSDEIYELLDYPAYEIDDAMEWWKSIIHPDDSDSIKTRSHSKRNSDQQSVISEFRAKRSNGDWHWFNDISDIVERDQLGNPTRLICVISDNHDSRVNQNELTHTKQMLEETGRMANVGGWEYNLESSTLSWTDETYRIHELEIGIPIDIPTAISFYTEESSNTLEPLVQACITSGTPYDVELELETAKGKTIFVRTIGVAETNNGKVRRIYGTIQDVTENRSTLASLEIAKNEAESASHAKSEFLANMSHEIRTPLTAILGNAELMENDEEFISNPNMLIDSIKSIQRNADHLLTIINDILDSSKIDAGMMQLETIEINPSELIAEATDMLFSRARTKGIELSVVYKDELPRLVESDPTRIRQILINLVGNAIKFTDAGAVRVEVGYNALPDKAGMIVLRVIDTGIGITKQSLESLVKFEAFNQADGSMTRQFGGTGLGLRITNSLVNLLGGSLSLESELGVGTRVTANLRVQPVLEHGMWRPPEVNGQKSEKAASAPADLSKEKVLIDSAILLVEDGEDNQRLITYMLERAGAKVIPALNGKEAVDVYKNQSEQQKSNPFDIILMDMQMPELDGYSATMQLRKLGFTGPIIALTAHAMAGDRERCIEAGCQEYLTKPIKAARLVESCKRLLDYDCGFAEAA